MERLGRVLLLMLTVTSVGLCQTDNRKSELGLALGGEAIANTSTSTGDQLGYSASVTYSVNYARRLSSGNPTLFLEFPLAASPSHSVGPGAQAASAPRSITSLATLYVTPSLRVQFATASRFSPWVSGGFGYGLFEGSTLLRNGAPNPQIHKNTGTAQFGGGVDICTPLKLLVPIGIRAEIRDYYTVDTPSLGVPARNRGQHHVVGAGGFVLRF